MINRSITFSDVKVHNEIELCTVLTIETKNEIEQLFLKNRLSYFEKWEKATFWQRLLGEQKERCTLCVNEAQKEKAQELIASLKHLESNVIPVMQKVDKVFF